MGNVVDVLDKANYCVRHGSLSHSRPGRGYFDARVRHVARQGRPAARPSQVYRYRGLRVVVAGASHSGVGGENRSVHTRAFTRRPAVSSLLDRLRATAADADREAAMDVIRRAAEADPRFGVTVKELLACGVTLREAEPLARAVTILHRAFPRPADPQQ